MKEIWASGTILDGNSTGRFFRDYINGRAPIDGYKVLYKIFDIGDDGLGYRYITGPRRAGATKGKYYQGIPLEMITDGGKETFQPIKNFIDLSANFGNCRTEGSVDFRSGKKPEEYIRILLLIIPFIFKRSQLARNMPESSGDGNEMSELLFVVVLFQDLSS